MQLSDVRQISCRFARDSRRLAQQIRLAACKSAGFRQTPVLSVPTASVRVGSASSPRPTQARSPYSLHNAAKTSPRSPSYAYRFKIPGAAAGTVAGPFCMRVTLCTALLLARGALGVACPCLGPLTAVKPWTAPEAEVLAGPGVVVHTIVAIC